MTIEWRVARHGKRVAHAYPPGKRSLCGGSTLSDALTVEETNQHCSRCKRCWRVLEKSKDKILSGPKS